MPGDIRLNNQFLAIIDQIRRGVTPEQKSKLIERARQLQKAGANLRIPLDILGGDSRGPGAGALVPVPKEPSPVRLTDPNAPPQYTGTARPRGTRAIPARNAGALVPIPNEPDFARGPRAIPARNAGALVPIPRDAVPGGGGGGAAIPGGGGGGAAIPGSGGGSGDIPQGRVLYRRELPTIRNSSKPNFGRFSGSAGMADDVARTVGRRGLSPNWKRALAGAGLVAGAVALNALKDNRQGDSTDEFEGSTVPPSQRNQGPSGQAMQSKPAEADMPAYKGQGPMSKAMGVTRNDDGKVDVNKVKLGQGWMFDMTRRIGQKGFDQPGMERRGQKLGSSGRDDIAQMFRTSDYANKELNLSEREINAAVEAFKRDFNRQQFKGQSYAADRLPRGTSAPAGTVVPRKVLSTPEYRARYGR